MKGKEKEKEERSKRVKTKTVGPVWREERIIKLKHETN